MTAAYWFISFASGFLAAVHTFVGGPVVDDSMTAPQLNYDKIRYGDMTWKSDELRHALVMSFYAGGLLALTISVCFAMAALDPAKRFLAQMGTVLCFGMSGAAIAVDGDVTMAISTAPPVIVWTVLGSVGTLALMLSGGGGKGKTA